MLIWQIVYLACCLSDSLSNVYMTDSLQYMIGCLQYIIDCLTDTLFQSNLLTDRKSICQTDWRFEVYPTVYADLSTFYASHHTYCIAVWRNTKVQIYLHSLQDHSHAVVTSFYFLRPCYRFKLNCWGEATQRQFMAVHNSSSWLYALKSPGKKHYCSRGGGGISKIVLYKQLWQLLNICCEKYNKYPVGSTIYLIFSGFCKCIYC